jgi:hypothetical protein
MKRKINSLKVLFIALFLLAASTSKAQIIDVAGFTAGTLGAFCADETVKLTAAAPGATSTTWVRYAGSAVSGTAVPITGTGTTTSTISDTPPAPGYYTYVSTSTNADGCATISDPAIVYYLPGITAAITSSIPGTTGYCENNFPGTAPTFTAAAGKVTTSGTVTETFGYKYQWYKGTSVISGAIAATYTLNNADDVSVGANNYSVKITYQVKACTETASNSITITVTAKPTKPTISLTP